MLYLVCSFGITWALIFPAIWLGESKVAVNLYVFTLRFTPSGFLSLAANLGPATAALIVLSRPGLHAERMSLARKIIALRNSARIYLLSFLIPSLILALALIELSAITGITLNVYEGTFGMWVDLFLFHALLRALGEEVGWRGFLLPKLQLRMNGLYASIMTGLAWWTWHLPIRFEPGQPVFLTSHLLYLLDILSLSIILTWLRNSSRGSLVPVTIFHSAFNAGLSLLQVPRLGWIQLRWNLCLSTTLLLAAGLLLVIFGSDLLSKQHAASSDYA